MSRIWVPKRPGKEFAKDYNTINPADSDTLREAKIESWIAKKLGTRLTELYPNRNWAVRVDVRGQVIVVQCPDISVERGWVIKMKNRTTQEILDMLPRVGGEILERGRITRARHVDQDLVESLPRTVREELKTLDNG